MGTSSKLKKTPTPKKTMEALAKPVVVDHPAPVADTGKMPVPPGGVKAIEPLTRDERLRLHCLIGCDNEGAEDDMTPGGPNDSLVRHVPGLIRRIGLGAHCAERFAAAKAAGALGPPVVLGVGGVQWPRQKNINARDVAVEAGHWWFEDRGLDMAAVSSRACFGALPWWYVGMAYPPDLDDYAEVETLVRMGEITAEEGMRRWMRLMLRDTRWAWMRGRVILDAVTGLDKKSLPAADWAAWSAAFAKLAESMGIVVGVETLPQAGDFARPLWGLMGAVTQQVMDSLDRGEKHSFPWPGQTPENTLVLQGNGDGAWVRRMLKRGRRVACEVESMVHGFRP